MPERFVVRGQRVEEEKRAFARRMRKEPTPAECVLWEALRGKKLDGLNFRRQQPIDGFIVDFYCDRAGVFVEVDGGIHKTQREADEDREQVIRRRELRVVRCTNEEVLHSLPVVLDRIREACGG